MRQISQLLLVNEHFSVVGLQRLSEKASLRAFSAAKLEYI